jgi:hypothetical protein
LTGGGISANVILGEKIKKGEKKKGVNVTEKGRKRKGKRKWEIKY